MIYLSVKSPHPSKASDKNGFLHESCLSSNSSQLHFFKKNLASFVSPRDSLFSLVNREMKNLFIDYLANPHYIYLYPPALLHLTHHPQHPVTPLPSPTPSPPSITGSNMKTCILRFNIRFLINNLAVSRDVRHAFNVFSMRSNS